MPRWLIGLNPRRRLALVAVCIVAVVAGIGAGGWLALGVAGAGGLRPDDEASVARGASLYAVHCASCHGVRLEGQPDWRRRGPNGRLPAPPHDESGHTWHHADELLVRLTKHGPGTVAGPDYQSDMPAFEGVLTDEQVVDVLSYIKSTWPRAVRDVHDGINRQTAR